MSKLRSQQTPLAVSALMLLMTLGCGGAKTPPSPPVRPIVPLSIRRPDSPLKVFSGLEEAPGVTYAFEGAPGSVRVTMEIDAGSAAGASNPAPPSVNDVLFKAEGEGRIAIVFKRPWPEHPNGRVTIQCRSGDELSSAEFEPELWFHLPGAIVTCESAPGETNDSLATGKEIVLGRYVARNLPRDIRLTFKAVFSKEPVTPRTKAGLKAPG